MSNQEQKDVIALKLEIEDETTGAVASHHVLSSYTVYLQNNSVHAMFATYVSKRAYEAGKQPVSHSASIHIAALPPTNEPVAKWIYRHAAAPAGEDNYHPSPLAGAELVYAD
ncbi:MAG: hypothetical protein Q4A62_03405 [Eikenella sp.]|nr:hypothetical protein [Eikenella sp.]